jgi:uncharacterized protein YegL
MFSVLIGLILPYTTDAQASSLVSVEKSLSDNNAINGGVVDVTLKVKGTPADAPIITPSDVVLIIDKSGSMQTDNRLEAAKNAAKEFIDLMDLTKHQVGIVDFSTSVGSYNLSTDAEAAKSHIDSITLGGNTKTGDAVRKATELLSSHRDDAQPTIVILTDGAADSSSDALAAAKAAKDAGIIFYSIALLGPNENPDLSAPNQLLKNMSTTADHHHFVLGSVGLDKVYKKIVEQIGIASAYNVRITDTVSSEFEIVEGSYDNNIPKPTVNGNTLVWDLKELKSNELTFTYQIRVKDSTPLGTYPVGTTVTTYNDQSQLTYTLDSKNPNFIVRDLDKVPQISHIVGGSNTPLYGPVAGGNKLMIYGTNLRGDSKAYIGGKEAIVEAVFLNSMRVKIPPGEKEGFVTVRVENRDGYGTELVDAYEYTDEDRTVYEAPIITSLSMTSGSINKTHTITINGANFRNSKVFVDGEEMTSTFLASNRLRFTLPASSTVKTVEVTVVNPDGQSFTLEDAFTYEIVIEDPPVINSLSLTNGAINKTHTITVYGAKFKGNSKVLIDGVEVTSTYLASNRLRFTLPASSTVKTVDVTVINPDGQSFTMEDAFTYTE